MNGGDDGWPGGNRDGGGTPPRRGGSPGARRSSRSRSPKRNGGGDDKQNGCVGFSLCSSAGPSLLTCGIDVVVVVTVVAITPETTCMFPD
jgi:hypothetical protein